MTEILITRPLPEAVLEEAHKLGHVTLRPATTPLSDAELRGALEDYDAVLPTLGDMFSAYVFTDVPKPRARILANFGVGYNHIDVAAAQAAGLTVTNTPGAVTDATSDIALTLMLMSARRAGEGERLVRSGNWAGWHPTQMLGLHMSGKHVGIIGMGRIGQAIAARCHHGFGMQVSFYNRSPKQVGLPATQVESLTELAARVDFLVVAVPGGADTQHLIGAEVFAAMQPHARFINIARGEVVDEAALITALQTGQIGAAGLDVYEHEPDVPEALKTCENAVLLPHLGTATEEVRTDMGLMAVDNLRAFLAGETPPNLV
ncbi:D-glycerate dehydrogenase [Primorskyibacter aestuariivivens]|uniref:2-hydroxyacid dehydrogenase n=1 Tax=Primorskyibacter aestuariivivens TaxID=1888912 RepID=UPI0023014BFC|nr:D-glycerate dehydrogenase [Primorskyibacter aestuariivivens]MDA7428196.1 D-glycerate dehydrogenase [Primorskyibacter aestuariivivens]